MPKSAYLEQAGLGLHGETLNLKGRMLTLVH